MTFGPARSVSFTTPSPNLVINLLIETDRVQLLAGDQQLVEAPPDDGSTQRIFRCPTCQVAV